MLEFFNALPLHRQQESDTYFLPPATREVYGLGDTPDPRQGARPPWNPGGPEGLAPSGPFQGGLAGCVKTYASKR